MTTQSTTAFSPYGEATTTGDDQGNSTEYIVERHYTAGFDYVASAQSEVNFGLVYVPEMSVTGTGGMQIKHSQLNAQIMYSYKF